MAVRLAEAALVNVPNALNCANREDLIAERIIECHRAIRQAADDVLGTPPGERH
jgi:phage baseplate assembly protein W